MDSSNTSFLFIVGNREDKYKKGSFLILPQLSVLILAVRCATAKTLAYVSCNCK